MAGCFHLVLDQQEVIERLQLIAMFVGDQPGVSLADRRDRGQPQLVDGAAPPVLFHLVATSASTRVMPQLTLSDQVRLQDSPQFLHFFLVL